MNDQINKAQETFTQHVTELQEQIIGQLQKIDPEVQLLADDWDRKDFKGEPGGGGRTRVLKGHIIENAGVNVSTVFGHIDPQFAAKLRGDGDQLWASGISLIIHPRNPRVPTVHANFRMICQGGRYWFGGGADLTPYYPHTEDFHYFHQVWKKACAPYDCYPAMKKECDEYFVNHHRKGEMRGIGGIFFDHFFTEDLDRDFNQVKHLSDHFIQSYFPIVEKRVHETWDSADEQFQLYRRGRYVEFNLLHDRGTLFGLRTNGRTESILVSLPARCEFHYRYECAEGSPQEEMNTYYRPFEW
jgi:coproporphyrinogen III oxidase